MASADLSGQLPGAGHAGSLATIASHRKVQRARLPTAVRCCGAVLAAAAYDTMMLKLGE